MHSKIIYVNQKGDKKEHRYYYQKNRECFKDINYGHTHIQDFKKDIDMNVILKVENSNVIKIIKPPNHWYSGLQTIYLLSIYFYNRIMNNNRAVIAYQKARVKT